MWPTDKCLLHAERCNCRAIDRLTEAERDQVQDEWMSQWLEVKLAERARLDAIAEAETVAKVVPELPVIVPTLSIRTADGRELLTVAQAAERLGLSRRAIEKRAARQALATFKTDDGRVWVYADSLAP